ncbi:glycosyltransferase family 4 protein [Oscillatoria sp. FACHB-1406]|uniref:glycosyltransferase family 4 protein n=1 Tax=Oscillatoria sp. FACHB-1406 TaxID=2692846 RepID=UPI0016890303|nr:glycosyltransferase family 4 protein [Oscillatoria sp. FACHB-1406]MBD2576921.1 glycosyltransferase family 4 protein [Oscillatoria sp. FACHB-1406]
MKILLYSYNYYPEPIGIAPLMTDLAEGLVKRGHQVRVVTAVPWYPKSEIYEEYRGKLYVTEERNGVKIHRCYVRSSPKRSFLNRALFEISFASLSFIQALGGWRPDLLIFTVPGLPVGYPATLLSKIYGCPTILNLQDILPDAAVHVGLISGKKAIRVFEAIERFNYRAADKITVIAEGFRDNLLAKGVPADKIVLIPNWVDTNFIKPLPRDENEFRRQNNLEGKFVVLYSGNIALTQGLETVIDAAKYLADYPEIAIVIVGEEKALARLEDYCQQQGATNVTLRPFQPREKLPEMLAAADVGLVVQKKNVIAFNMPSKIQVLLASGRAIIASVPATGTAAKAIATSGGGLVVAPEDPKALAEAILELYQDPERSRTLGEKSRQHALENYAFEEALDRYEQLFARMVKS